MKYIYDVATRTAGLPVEINLIVILLTILPNKNGNKITPKTPRSE